ncbi:MAG: PIN domain-containing protein [Beijerinckiaceae bacterium]|jgi:tRNA(fMet)-specific endonuclease VapC
MFCLDTNAIVFALNKRRPAIDARLQVELAAGTMLLISAIAIFELRYGIAKSDRREASGRLLDVFLAERFEILRFDSEDAEEAGSIRAHLEKQGTPIGPYDVLIAAQARRRGAALVTTNRREFERVPGLIVTDWAV